MSIAREATWLGALPSSARRVAILLHGRDQDPAVMDAHVVRRLVAAAPELAEELGFCAPAAPGRTWYPASFLAPEAQNQPALGASLARIAALVDELAGLGWPARDQLLVGFSQGACLACAYLHTTPSPPAALIAFTGGLPGPPNTAFGPARARLHGVRVAISGAARDPWVPAARMVETTAVFRRDGAIATLALRDDDRHEISDGELARAIELLRRPAPAAARATERA